MRSHAHDPRTVRLATAYSEASDDAGQKDEETPAPEAEESFTIPEDFAELSDADLNELHGRAIEAFDALYGDGSDLDDEALETLGTLTEGIESLNEEVASREALASERSEKARALAAKVKGEDFNADTEDGGSADSEDDEDGEDEDGDEEGEDSDQGDESAAETVTASAKSKRKSININLGNFRNRQSAVPPKAPEGTGIRQHAFNAEGEGTDWRGLADNLAHRLRSMPQSQYATAAARGKHLREQFSLGTFRKPFSAEQTVTSNDPEHVEKVMSYAVDESRLPQGSLVASGGWCAPSETLYDFLELESRDGLISLPEINVTRGGIQFTQGPNFADIYADTGFSFTEQDDIEGNYPGPEGNKPFYHVDCPEFDEVRLAVEGLAINAGLLQLRAYPEVIQRVIRGALVAHDHKMSATLTSALASGSDEVIMPTPQVGATAPILNSIDLQVEHYRTVHRMNRNTTLEAVFPAWTYGAIRADLARRDGLEVFEVSDSRINAWFSQRNVSPQFVYNWQSIDGDDAAQFTAWPTEVSFLLYAAGTWVRGSSDIITLDTIYDSVNLAQNDYTALFTEEGWLAAKRGHDSRLVTVGIDATGSVGSRVEINHDGTAGDGGDGGGE